MGAWVRGLGTSTTEPGGCSAISVPTRLLRDSCMHAETFTKIGYT